VLDIMIVHTSKHTTC